MYAIFLHKVQQSSPTVQLIKEYKHKSASANCHVAQSFDHRGSDDEIN
jgi:hypothetical protein